MTAAVALEKQQLNRAEQLEQLRRQMAAVSGKVGARWRPAEPDNDALPDLNLCWQSRMRWLSCFPPGCRRVRSRCSRGPVRCRWAWSPR